jgi:hypothetical protein
MGPVVEQERDHHRNSKASPNQHHRWDPSAEGLQWPEKSINRSAEGRQEKRGQYHEQRADEIYTAF